MMSFGKVQILILRQFSDFETLKVQKVKSELLGLPANQKTYFALTQPAITGRPGEQLEPLVVARNVCVLSVERCL